MKKKNDVTDNLDGFDFDVVELEDSVENFPILQGLILNNVCVQMYKLVKNFSFSRALIEKQKSIADGELTYEGSNKELRKFVQGEVRFIDDEALNEVSIKELMQNIDKLLYLLYACKNAGAKNYKLAQRAIREPIAVREEDKEKFKNLIKDVQQGEFQKENECFLNFVDAVTSYSKFLVQADKVYALASNVDFGNLEDVKCLINLNKKLASTFNSLIDPIVPTITDENHARAFAIIGTSFLVNTTSLNSKYQKYVDELNEASKQNETVASVDVEQIKAVSPKEQERLDAIDKANKAYDRLQKDYLVDLQKQYLTSDIDGYHKIMDKVEDFEKKFNLPLNNKASIGLAKDVLHQLDKITDSIYNLAEQSYISGGFFN